MFINCCSSLNFPVYCFVLGKVCHFANYFPHAIQWLNVKSSNSELRRYSFFRIVSRNYNKQDVQRENIKHGIYWESKEELCRG